MEQRDKDRLTILETQQAERHEVNQKQLKKIDDTVSIISSQLGVLQVHEVEITNAHRRISKVWTVIGFLIFSILGIAFVIIQGAMT